MRQKVDSVCYIERVILRSLYFVSQRLHKSSLKMLLCLVSFGCVLREDVLVTGGSTGGGGGAGDGSSAVATAPSLSFTGATGTNSGVDEALSISPTTLSANGSPITDCKVKPGSTNEGSFPGTLSVNSTTCVISGTPTAILAPTTFTLVATNSVGDSSDATVSIGVFDYTQVGPFAGHGLAKITGIPDANVSGYINPSTYPRSSPYSGETLMLNSNIENTASSTQAPFVFLRAHTLDCSGGSAIFAQGESVPLDAGSNVVFRDGGAGAGGGGGGSRNSLLGFNASSGGAGGSNGVNGDGCTDGGPSFNYSGGYSFGNAGNGGSGGSAGGIGAPGGAANGSLAGGGGGGNGGPDGSDPGFCGAGGGGGGGIVAIVAYQLGCSITVSVDGGNGGDNNSGIGSPQGTGAGGGGGGVAWFALRSYSSGQINCSASGGAANNTFNGGYTAATNGTAGQCRIFQINDDGSLTARSFSDSW